MKSDYLYGSTKFNIFVYESPSISEDPANYGFNISGLFPDGIFHARGSGHSPVPGCISNVGDDHLDVEDSIPKILLFHISIHLQSKFLDENLAETIYKLLST